MIVLVPTLTFNEEMPFNIRRFHGSHFLEDAMTENLEVKGEI